MTDIVEMLREWSTCNVFPEQAQYAVSAACLEITSLRAEVVSNNEQFQQYARKMESDMNALAAQNEKLRAALHGVIRVADRKTAEFDEARAALEETKHECL